MYQKKYHSGYKRVQFSTQGTKQSKLTSVQNSVTMKRHTISITQIYINKIAFTLSRFYIFPTFFLMFME